MPAPVSSTVNTASSPLGDEPDGDASLARRELHGVRQQIGDDLLEARLVARDPDRRQMWRSSISFC